MQKDGYLSRWRRKLKNTEDTITNNMNQTNYIALCFIIWFVCILTWLGMVVCYYVALCFIIWFVTYLAWHNCVLHGVLGPVHTYPKICASSDFFYEYGLRPHVSAVFSGRIRKFLKTLSRVEIF